MKPKNVLVLLVDCLRADAVARCSARGQIPGLERVFGNAARVPDVFSVASTTAPAVSSLLTGCYPYKHGVRTLYGYQLNPRRPTLPHLLRRQGYHTEAYLTGPFFQDLGLKESFDVLEYRPATEYVHGPWGDRLAAILRERVDRPRFVMVHLWELHFPKQVLRGFRTPGAMGMYDGALRSLDRYIETKLADLDLRDTVVILTGDHGEWVTRFEWAWGLVKRTIFKALRVEARPERIRHWKRFKTRVLDPVKGGARNERLKIGHGFSVKEPLIRIPLWIRAGAEPPRIVPKPLTSQIDIAPTLLELLGQPAVDGAEGLSLLGPARHDAIYLEECLSIRPDPPRVMKGVRTETAKYIVRPFASRPQQQLYDLAADPRERRNRAHDPRFAGQREELQRRLRLFSDETAEQYLRGYADEDEGHDVVAARLRDLGYFE